MPKGPHPYIMIGWTLTIVGAFLFVKGGLATLIDGLVWQRDRYWSLGEVVNDSLWMIAGFATCYVGLLFRGRQISN